MTTNFATANISPIFLQSPNKYSLVFQYIHDSGGIKDFGFGLFLSNMEGTFTCLYNPSEELIQIIHSGSENYNTNYPTLYFYYFDLANIKNICTVFYVLDNPYFNFVYYNDIHNYISFYDFKINENAYYQITEPLPNKTKLSVNCCIFKNSYTSISFNLNGEITI